MTASKHKIEKVGERVYLVTAGQNKAVVQFTRGDDASFEPSNSTVGWAASVSNGAATRSILYQPWGARNDMPQARERLILDNNVVGALMETKRDVHIGLGLRPVVTEFIDGKSVVKEVEMPAEAKAFFDAIDIDKFLLEAFGELTMHGMFIPELVRLKSGKIIAAEVKKSRHMRSGRKNTEGVVSAWYWCGDWGRKSRKEFPVKEIPLYDPQYENKNGWNRQPKFVYPIGCSLLTDDYYNIPIWSGSRDWIELANIIPKFHLYNLENGFTPRWHITIPQDYFKGVSIKGLSIEDMASEETKEEAARQEFLNKLNKYLAGIPGVGRALVTDEYFEPLAKQFSGIKIKALDVDLKDEAMLKLYEKSNQAVIAAQGIHPTLAAIETGSTRAGGSEILRALQLYLITKTKQPRNAVLRFIKLVHRINGWDERISWVFRDETLTTLADNKDGATEVPPKG